MTLMLQGDSEIQVTSPPLFETHMEMRYYSGIMYVH